MTRPKSTGRIKKDAINTGIKRDWKVGDTIRVVYADGPILDPETDYPKGSKQPFSITKRTEVTDRNTGEVAVSTETEHLGMFEVTESDTHGAKGVVTSIGKNSTGKKK